MNRYIKILFATSVVLFVYIYAKAVAVSIAYVVPARSNKYHDPSCRWARKFRSENMVTLHSAKDALAAGYTPCKVCKPPIKD